MDDFEKRLAAGLEKIAAEAEVPTTALEVVVRGRATADVVLLSEVDGSSIDRRPRTYMAAAAAVLIVAAIGAMVALARPRAAPVVVPAETASPLVLPGEVVIGTDPLVVIAAPSPEPMFDTSDLGEEIVFEPVEPGDEASFLDPARWQISDDVELIKVVLMGRVDGQPWALTIVDMKLPGQTMRWRLVDGPTGGNSSAAWTDPGATELFRLAPGSNENPLSFGVPGGPVTWDGLSSDVAVVSYQDDDTLVWIRPKAGVAAVPVDLNHGDRFELNAYTADGEHVGMTAATVEAPPSDDPAGLHIGPIRGQAADGSEIWIGNDGRVKVLAFGATWCTPCDAVPAELIRLIGRFDGQVDMYAVMPDPDSEDLWPTDPDWPYPRMVMGDSPLPLDTLPIVVIVDGNNDVITSLVGEELDELEQVLESALGNRHS